MEARSINFKELGFKNKNKNSRVNYKEDVVRYYNKEI